MITTRFKAPKLIVVLIALLLVQAPAWAKETLSKSYSKSFTVNPDASLQVKNKFGKVHVTTGTGNTISIDVKVEVNGKSESNAQKMLDKIDVELSGNANLVQAKTIFSSMKSQHGEYSIDYTITMPATNSLQVKNQFGPVYVSSLKGMLSLDVEYGNIQVGDIENNESKITLGFGEAEFSKLTKADLEIQYSEVDVQMAGELDLDTQFSTIKVEKADRVDMDAHYDTYKLDQIGRIDGAAEFSKIEIDEVATHIEVDNSYGGLKLKKVAKGFEKVAIDNQFAEVQVGLESGSSFSVNVAMSFAGLNAPSKWDLKRSGTKGLSETHSGKVNGAAGSVTIESEYGEVTLKEN